VRLPQAGPAMARHSWAVWWPTTAEGRQRQTSSILAAIAQRRAVRLMMVGAHVTVRRRGSLCRCRARSSTKLEMRKTGGRSREGRGGAPEVPGVVDLRRVFASREWRSGATFSKLLARSGLSRFSRSRSTRGCCMLQSTSRLRWSPIRLPRRSLRRGKSRQPTARGAHPGWGVRHGL
jgi:hypothetical protein